MNDRMLNIDEDSFAPEASNAGDLAKMLKMEASAVGLYTPDELGEVLEHQWDAPIADDLVRLSPDIKTRLYDLLEYADPPIKTFGDLFNHPSPPVKLLDLIKRFSKIGHRDPLQPLPIEIARLLYYMTIIVALTRCDERITTLPDETLVKGIEMLRKWRWVDARTMAVLEEGYDYVSRRV